MAGDLAAVAEAAQHRHFAAAAVGTARAAAVEAAHVGVGIDRAHRLAGQAQLGDAVAVYLDDGPCTGDVPSTIVDLTGPVPVLLRKGVIPVPRLREVVALIVDEEEEEGA